MILLDINIDIKDYLNNSDNSNDNNITFTFINNYENYISLDNNIIKKTLKKGDIININCVLCEFIGKGSYGRVYKIMIGDNYYALKLSENEIPEKLIKRYMTLKSIEELNKYLITIHISGKNNSKKYPYFSIMDYGGRNLKSLIPFKETNELIFIIRQLYNMCHLIYKFKFIFTDFKLNNIVVNSYNLRCKLIDIYIECGNYSPCSKCKIIKTYSTIEIDKVKDILDDTNYPHNYHLIPLGIGLIDLLCNKTASNIITSLSRKFNINLGLKAMIPLIQLACYNNIHKSNNLLKLYEEIYYHKKKLEKKYPFIKEPIFYKTFMNLIEVRDIYKNNFSSKKLHLILLNLFSACPEDRTLEYLKTHLSEFS